MAPARPYWKGYLKLSLVSCPIAIYTGTSSTERVSFRQINKKTGNRLRQQLVDEVTREPVEGEDKGRGYEYAKNAYIPVDDDELDAIAIESNQRHRDRLVRSARANRRAVSGQPLLHHAGRPSRAGRICSDPRGHARQGDGSPRSCRAGEARAGHRAPALGQGADGHHASLSIRDQGRKGIFRRHSRREGRDGYAQAGPA